MTLQSTLDRLLEFLKAIGWARALNSDTAWGDLPFCKLKYETTLETPIRVSPIGYIICQPEHDRPASADDLLSHVRLFLNRFDPVDRHTNLLLVSDPLLPDIWQGVLGQNLHVVPVSQAEIASAIASRRPLDDLCTIIAPRSHPADLSDYDPSVHACHRVFSGRKSHLNRILRRELTPFALTGARRIGKTSLVHAVLRELHAQDAEALLVNCHPYSSLHSCLGVLIGQVIPSRTIRDSYDSADYIGLLRNLSKELGGTVHVLLDEVDSLIQQDRAEFYRFLAAMRTAQESRWARLILSGWKRLDDCLSDTENPLFGRLEQLELATLHRMEGKELIVQPAQRYAIRFEDEAATVNDILNATGGHPFFITVLCQALIEQLSRSERTIPADAVQDVRPTILTSLLATLRSNTSALEELIVHVASTLEPTFAEQSLKTAVQINVGHVDSKLWRGSLQHLRTLDLLDGVGASLVLKLPMLRECMRLDSYNFSMVLQELIEDVVTGRGVDSLDDR
jgi:hypothetical protein